MSAGKRAVIGGREVVIADDGTVRGGAGTNGGRIALNTASDITITVPSPADLVAQAVDQHGWWDGDWETYLIPIEAFGVKGGGPSEQADATYLLELKDAGMIGFPEPENMPIDRIDGTVQSELRADALAWYVNHDKWDQTTWDDEVSFYGAAGPLAIETRDGRVVILDGCHRYVAAKLRGDRTLRLQVLRRPAA
ncbi:hypothetical protein [Agromyces humi]|uniref:hypothetical protein n=1 Tax=Agromyces humi TaxID=1766800 RepID=UPI001356C104|nr:hypothetical protein [Agromyces humi]